MTRKMEAEIRVYKILGWKNEIDKSYNGWLTNLWLDE